MRSISHFNLKLLLLFIGVFRMVICRVGQGDWVDHELKPQSDTKTLNCNFKYFELKGVCF